LLGTDRRPVRFGTAFSTRLNSTSCSGYDSTRTDMTVPYNSVTFSHIPKKPCRFVYRSYCTDWYIASLFCLLLLRSWLPWRSEGWKLMFDHAEWPSKQAAMNVTTC
jgi:hypothetical protein